MIHLVTPDGFVHPRDSGGMDNVMTLAGAPFGHQVLYSEFGYLKKAHPGDDVVTMKTFKAIRNLFL